MAKRGEEVRLKKSEREPKFFIGASKIATNFSGTSRDTKNFFGNTKKIPEFF